MITRFCNLEVIVILDQLSRIEAYWQGLSMEIISLLILSLDNADMSFL